MEHEPTAAVVPDDLRRVASQKRRLHQQRVRLASAASGGLFVLAAVVSLGLFLFGYSGAAIAVLVVAGVGLGGGTLLSIRSSSRAASASATAVTQAQAALESEFSRRTQQWRSAMADHEAAEADRVDRIPEWGAVPFPVGTRRLDVFGGNLWAWEAFLTVYGSSSLAVRPAIVVDLSRELVCAELTHLARGAGAPVDVQLLPDQLETTTLLSDLDSRHVVDALIESMYGDDAQSSRAERSMDDRILTAVCEALGEDVSLRRIAAGLRALLDQPDTSDALSRVERRHISDELFSGEYRTRATESLRRLEAYIHPLESLGARAGPDDPGYLTCIALASEGRNVRSELLTDLIVQWLTHRIIRGATATPDVIIAGADMIATRNLERLADVCERRHVRLTLLFRHLRETGLDVIGGGAVGFMTMGNHVEATRAADFIGRDHTFVLSQITKTLGGNESHTDTESAGRTDTWGINVSAATGWTKNWNRGSSRASRATDIAPTDGTITHTKGRAGGTSGTRTEGMNRSMARNWSASRAYAEGTNWSDAQMKQRVYEYRVEPSRLQHLPDHAMILVQSADGQPRLVPVEFDPAIVTLPRVSPGPFSAQSRPLLADEVPVIEERLPTPSSLEQSTTSGVERDADLRSVRRLMHPDAHRHERQSSTDV